MSKSKKHDHILPRLLVELHWLPLDHRINFKILLIAFKVLHNQAPTYLIDLLIHYHPSRFLRSSAKIFLWNLTYNRKTYGGRYFAVSTPSLCNALPQSVRDSTSLDTFKSRLKKHFFDFKCLLRILIFLLSYFGFTI